MTKRLSLISLFLLVILNQICAKGYAHCIGGRLDWGDGNDFWAYPLNEPMTFENLIEFGGVPGATWDWNILQLTTLRLNGAKLTSNLDRSY